MQRFWWLEIVGYLCAVLGGWRLLWRIPVIFGLLGANKLGAEGKQAEINKQNIEIIKKKLPMPIILLAVGIILVCVF